MGFEVSLQTAVEGFVAVVKELNLKKLNKRWARRRNGRAQAGRRQALKGAAKARLGRNIDKRLSLTV
jgi:hypothetical protein